MPRWLEIVCAGGGAVVLAIGAAACATSGPTSLRRTVGGEVRIGRVVSPASYEAFIRAELAWAKGELAEAEHQLALARAGPADDAFLMARHADLLDRLGRRADADEVLRDATEYFAADESSWLGVALVSERRGDFTRAVDAYRRAAAVAPRSAKGPLALARLLRDRGADARAEAVLERYLRRAGPGSEGACLAHLELALARGDGQAAAYAVEALLRLAPARVDDVRRAARAALASERPDLAVELLERVPESEKDARLRVEAWIDLGDRGLAASFLASRPAEFFGGLVAHAELNLDAGRAEAAAELASLAVRLDPNPEARLVLGRAWLALGRPADAAMELARVPLGAVGHSAARRALAEALTMGGLGAVAMEVLASAAAAPTDDSIALRRSLAEARLARSDREGALDAVAGFSTAGDRATQAHVLERIGRFAEAADVYATLPLEAPELSLEERARADAERALRAEDRAAAVAALEALVERDPADLAARVRLTELLVASGRLDDARAVAGDDDGFAERSGALVDRLLALRRSVAADAEARER